MKKKDLKKVKLSDEANSRILGRFKSELNIDVDKIYKDLEQQNLLQEERPKKSKKPLVLAISCTLVVAVAGIIIGSTIDNGFSKMIMHKNVESLNLDGDDYCLAFYYGNNDLTNLNSYLGTSIEFDGVHKEHYLVNDDNVDKLITIDANGVKDEYVLNLPESFDEILTNYNATYNNILDLNRLNDDDYGLLFIVADTKVDFYIFNKEHKVYSVNI